MLCLPLSGCASPPAWKLYDACAAQTSGFVAMVECGKAKRQAACREHDTCSDLGNAFVQYADGLAAQVRSHEISEADAMTRFAEYKTKTIQSAQQTAATAAAAAPPVVVQQAPVYVPPPVIIPRY
jgi:hypothetical protein